MRRPSPEILALFIDGELSAREIRLLDEYLRVHPEIRRQVEAERALRRHVGEAMRSECPSAPLGLEERVRRLLVERRADIVGTIRGPRSPSKICAFCGEDCSTRPRVKNPQGRYACRACVEARQRTRRGGPTTPSRRPARTFAVRGAAAAALIALSAFAVVFGLVGPRVGDPGTPTGAHILAAADKVAGEHVLLGADRGKLVGSLSFWTPQEASRALSLYLDRPVRIFDLTSAGYEFVGAGVCSVPNCDHACHVVYRSLDKPGVFAIIHFAVDKGQFALSGLDPLDASTDEIHVIPAAPTRPEDVVVWSDGSLLYLLTADNLTGAGRVVSSIRHES